MTTIQSITSINQMPTTQPSGDESPWQQLLTDWQTIESLENDVKDELTKNPPNWADIKTKLTKMETLSEEMTAIARNNNLNPPSDPGFSRTTLEKLTTIIQSMIAAIPNQNEVEGDLPALDNQMCIIFQDILQGMDIKNH